MMKGDWVLKEVLSERVRIHIHTPLNKGVDAVYYILCLFIRE